jgi:hypothetical protein
MTPTQVAGRKTVQPRWLSALQDDWTWRDPRQSVLRRRRQPDSRRWPPVIPVATVGFGDHGLWPATRERHETRMRCPNPGYPQQGSNGAGGKAWPMSGHPLHGSFDDITILGWPKFDSLHLDVTKEAAHAPAANAYPGGLRCATTGCSLLPSAATATRQQAMHWSSWDGSD